MIRLLILIGVRGRRHRMREALILARLNLMGIGND
jgi:hypothetical protein